nr:hypothetical protein 4 [bacterium]
MKKKKRPDPKYWVIYQAGKFRVTDIYSKAFYPCTAGRLSKVAKSHGLDLVVTSKRSPRLATISRKDGRRSIQTDRLWDFQRSLQEAAELLFDLQRLAGAKRRNYLKKAGL